MIGLRKNSLNVILKPNSERTTLERVESQETEESNISVNPSNTEENLQVQKSDIQSSSQ